MQHNIGIYEMIAIVEHIQCNEHNAVRTRYVAVDVGALLLALKFQRNCSIEDIGANGNAPEIQIFDGKVSFDTKITSNALNTTCGIGLGRVFSRCKTFECP